MNSIFIDINNNIAMKSLLVISDDINFVQKIKENLDSNFSISFFNESKFQLLSNIINSFDVIIFDNDKKNLETFIESFKDINSYDINIPLIVLESKINKDNSLYKYANVFLVLKKPIEIALIKTNIDLCLNFIDSNKKKQFEEGFYFDINRELLFKGKDLIKLTKTERKLVKLLAQNVNVLVTYEEISQNVWKGKNFSIYSLRNVVKHIREKTSETFLKNSSNRGYIINTI